MLARHNGSFHGWLARCIKWRACDVGEAEEGLENELWRRWSNGKGWRMSCDVGEVRESLENELCSFSNLPSFYLRHSSFSNPSFASPTSQALHLIHLASHPWKEPLWRTSIPGIYRIPNLCNCVYTRYFIRTAELITAHFNKMLAEQNVHIPWSGKKNAKPKTNQSREIICKFTEIYFNMLKIIMVLTPWSYQ